MEAHRKYLLAPHTLTEEELAQSAVCNESFAELARQKRDGTLPSPSPAEAKAMALPATQGICGTCFKTWSPAGVDHRHLARELEMRVEVLESRPTVDIAACGTTPRSMAGRARHGSGSMWHATEASIGRRRGSDAAFGSWLSSAAPMAMMGRICDEHAASAGADV